MKRIDPKDRLTDGWEPAPPPVMGPNGVPILPNTRSSLAVLNEPPSLCSQGPCANYHELAAVMDSAQPMDGSELAANRQVVKTCYPDVGIELDLSGPVAACNRWEPIQPKEATRVKAQRDAYFKTPAGKKYKKEIAAWHAENKRLEKEAIAAATAEQAEEEAVEPVTRGTQLYDVPPPKPGSEPALLRVFRHDNGVLEHLRDFHGYYDVSGGDLFECFGSGTYLLKLFKHNGKAWLLANTTNRTIKEPS